MAGLLSDILGFVDRAKQSTRANVGLLMDNPQEYARQISESARDINRQDTLAVQGKNAMLSGRQPTPEQMAAMDAMRQRTENLAMGFAGTINKPVFYHGTNKPFENFANRLTYVTPNPAQASSYAGQVGANVRPVTLNVTKTYTGGNVDKILESVKKSDDYYPFTLSKIKEFIETKNPYAFGMPSVQKALKKLGYDSFVEIEGGVEQIGVFSPKNIKSIFEK
jgi:hypothetical protein